MFGSGFPVARFLPLHVRLIPTLLLFAAIAVAQKPPRADIFAGFSFANTNFGVGINASAYGYEIASQLKVRRWLGVVIDGNGLFGSGTVSVCLPSRRGCVNLVGSTFAQIYTESGGLEASKQTGRVTPFARALFGFATLSACPVIVCETKGSFSQAYGGGLEYRITEQRLGWRVQGEFVQTRFFSRVQNDNRFATGLVINFYKHR
jgi:hypothetical protein